jgi:hypothetical protein
VSIASAVAAFGDGADGRHAPRFPMSENPTGDVKAAVASFDT